MSGEMEDALGADEAVDYVAGQPAVTAWKRAARRHQHEWRQAHAWPPGLRPQRGDVDASKRIGNRIDFEFAKKTNVNFLDANEDIVAAVESRLRHPQRHQTLDEIRLYSDLLSSMPMCFNLFGPLHGKPDLAREVVRRWFPDVCPEDADVCVGFEWSPGRREKRWLDDRTAFDAAIFITSTSGRSVIGVETKYHEHPVRTPLTRKDPRTGQREFRKPKPRYIEVTDRAALFERPNWLEEIWGQRVEQIWRDHLLALACQQDPEGWRPARYVLVAPRGNPAWSSLADEYRSLSPAIAATFDFRTIEQLLDAADDLLPHAAQFRARYLDITTHKEER